MLLESLKRLSESWCKSGELTKLSSDTLELGGRTGRWALSRALSWIAAVGLVFSFSSYASSQDKSPIVIGQVGINSGPAGSYGRLQLVMLEIAVEDINAKGGINGSKVVLESADAELDPAKAVVHLRNFQRSNAVLALGFISGAQWEAAAPLANQIKMPVITANAAKAGITVRPWSLRFGPTDETNIPSALDAVRKLMPNAKKVVILSDMSQASNAAADVLLKKAAAGHGMEILQALEFTTGSTDLSPLAISIKGSGADLILVNALIPQALSLASEFNKQGITTPVFAHGFIWTGNFVSSAGATANNWLTFGWNTNAEVEGNQELYNNVAKRFIERASKDPSLGVPPNIANNTNAYDAMLFVAETLRAAGVDGNTPVDKAREVLKDGFVNLKEFKGLLNHSFTKSGDDVMQVRLLKPDQVSKTWKFAN